MASAADLQSLLRFLSQDAKVPLAMAMAKVKDLQSAGLTSSTAIAQADLKSIKTIFTDEKIAKQVHNAAKRCTKKRMGSDTNVSTPRKKRKESAPHISGSPSDLEETLALPVSSMDEEAISATTLVTNRAPLVLAFAVTLLNYTMPDQPLSSRLSLAQAVVSVNSRSKAVSLGLESGKSAEEEGWGQGQPVVRIMGREIRVLKRWGYEWPRQKDKKEPNFEWDTEAAKEVEGSNVAQDSKPDGENTTSEYMTAVRSRPGDMEDHDDKPALWGLDLEALKKSNGPIRPTAAPQTSGSLPIYTPQSARAYLLRSFASAEPQETSKPTTAKRSNVGAAAAAAAEREENLGLLIGALDMLYQSWAHVLSRDDLDKRAWSWYIHVRPVVEDGVAGWGGKGKVKLADILSLRRVG